MTKLTIIKFEDYWQDFLRWAIDSQTGEVIDCEPYQRKMWCGGYVLNHRKLKVGGRVVFYKARPDPQKDTRITIRYPIKSLRKNIRKPDPGSLI